MIGHGPLRIAVVGAGGRIARDYLTVVDRMDGVEVGALVESDAGARARLVESRREPVAQRLDEATAATLDAVLVLTPPATHEAVTSAALDSNLHVFCEKPLAPDPAAAQRMVTAARARRRVLMMASKFRFTRDVVAARELIARGAIGEPRSFRNAFCSHVPMTDRWNADPRLSGGGVLIDNGTHAVDLARVLLGEIERVRATRRPAIQRLAVEDRVVVEFEAAKGARGRIELSWSDPGGQPAYAEVDGARGSVVLGWRESTWRAADGSGGPLGKGYDKHEAFEAQLAHFAAVVRGTEAPRIDDEDALASVRFVAAAYRSMAEQRWVDIAELAVGEVA